MNTRNLPRTLCFIAVLFLSTQIMDAQPQAAEDAPSPPATIADVAFIAGHWCGSGLGGVNEEVWAPPLGNTMMGAYRLVQDGEVAFYELLTLSEVDNSLVLSLKHFNSNLTGWEEKDEFLTFRLVDIEPGESAHFEGLSYERMDGDRLRVRVVLSEEDDEVNEEEFLLRQQDHCR